MVWEKIEAGWYRLMQDGKCVAAVCMESHNPPWCTYVDKDMPPGDSQHNTCREAKQKAEELVRQKG